MRFRVPGFLLCCAFEILRCAQNDKLMVVLMERRKTVLIFPATVIIAEEKQVRSSVIGNLAILSA